MIKHCLAGALAAFALLASGAPEGAPAPGASGAKGDAMTTEVANLTRAGEGVREATRIRDFLFGSPGVSNCYLVTTGDGDVLVNTGLAPEAPQHRARFAAVSQAPVRAIFFTQSHGDHVGGTELFRGPDTRVIAQANYHDVTDYWQRFALFYGSRTRRLWGAVLGTADEPVSQPPPPPEPSETFRDRLELSVGERRFVLLATPGGETTDSLVVWMPDEKIVFTGNLFGPIFGHFPALYTLRGDKLRSAREFLRSLDRVAELGAELLVTGHGEPIEGRDEVANGLARIRAAVQYVYDETTRGMNEGRDVFTLMREIELPPELGVGQGHGKVSWGVRAIFEEHAGWFHYDTTAALYPPPPRAVWPELAELAGGAAPLAARARERLARGEPVEALHLLDIALAAEPAAREALEIKLAALETLLEASGHENFSETRWLQSQIEDVQSLLGDG
jgi:alkyl sulfatase BDS1-like metallo-beta-lactamase superfamily hydrolase